MSVHLNAAICQHWYPSEASMITPEFLNFQKKIEEVTCGICLNPCELDKKIVATDCNHLFHENCLALWANMHPNCPVCRADINEINKITVFHWNSKSIIWF